MSLKSVNNLCSKQASIFLHCKHDENYSTFKCFHHRINKSLMFLFPGCFPHIGLFSSEFCQICLTAMWGSPSLRLAASQFSVTFQHQGSVCRGIKARGGKNEVSDILTRQGTLLTMMMVIMTIKKWWWWWWGWWWPGCRYFLVTVTEEKSLGVTECHWDKTQQHAVHPGIQWVSSAQCIVKYVAKYSALVSSGLCSVWLCESMTAWKYDSVTVWHPHETLLTHFDIRWSVEKRWQWWCLWDGWESAVNVQAGKRQFRFTRSSSWQLGESG